MYKKNKTTILSPQNSLSWGNKRIQEYKEIKKILENKYKNITLFYGFSSNCCCPKACWQLFLNFKKTSFSQESWVNWSAILSCNCVCNILKINVKKVGSFIMTCAFYFFKIPNTFVSGKKSPKIKKNLSQNSSWRTGKILRFKLVFG